VNVTRPALTIARPPPKFKASLSFAASYGNVSVPGGEWSNAMGIISWIILGVVAGFIGSKIVNKSGQGFLMDIVLGVVGAVVGGVIFSAFGAAGVTGLNIYSLIVAVIGAVVVLWAYHAISGRSA
jgi:uncharacterized membrane protein YeaQ/YmgE (transglycosylase-associated protein family)